MHLLNPYTQVQKNYDKEQCEKGRCIGVSQYGENQKCIFFLLPLWCEFLSFGDIVCSDVCLLFNITELDGTFFVLLKAPKIYIWKTHQQCGSYNWEGYIRIHLFFCWAYIQRNITTVKNKTAFIDLSLSYTRKMYCIVIVKQKRPSTSHG